MSVKDVSSAWKTYLEGNSKTRFYLDSRQIDYANVGGAAQFTAVDAWRYGSHDLTDNYATYLLTMPSTFVFEILAYPDFTYDTASDQTIFSWYWAATNYFKLYYNATDDKFRVEYVDGGTARYLESQQFDDGVSHDDIAQWLTFTGSIDLTTGDTTGSQFWVNRVSKDTAWDGNIDARTIYYNKLQVRALNSVESSYKINYFRLFPNITCTDADVQNGFEDIYDEEVFWGFNGIPLGRTRYNISKFVTGYSILERNEKDNGSYCTNTASLMLTNEGIAAATGCFCDDQYAAFDPGSYQYNGTTADRYLRNRVPVWIETWYGTSFDSLYIGKVTEGGFPRYKEAASLSRITITCEDAVSDIARKSKKKAKWYDSYKLCDPTTETASLLHVITRLATKEDIINFAANSDFENATITDSWAEGANCTLTRDGTYELVGSYCGKAVFAGAGSFYQTVTFTGDTKLNVGDTYTFSLYVLSADAFEGDIKIGELDSGGENDNTSAAVSLAGGEGHVRFSVSHTITDSDSDRLKIEILSDAADTIYFDTAHLTYGNRVIYYHASNADDGTAGVYDADEAALWAGSYDTIGFDVDANALEHPWVRVEAGESPWEYVKDIADATPNLHYFGINSDGCLEYSYTASEAGDPASTETITTVRSVATELQPLQANKVIIGGVYVLEETAEHELWNAKADSGFDLPDTVADGSSWPPAATYGEYWAELGKVE